MATESNYASGDWMRITVRVTPEAVEAAGEILRSIGCAGWESTEDAVIGYIPVTEHTGERVAEVSARVAALADSGLDVGPAEVRAEVTPAQQWEEVWKSYFRPTRVGRIVICPTWETTELAPDEVLVLLDPGMAFGSGAHATTRLCLRAMQDAMSHGDRVLDVGTGSGILAIAAAKLGASRVLAVDNDPDVLPIAAENAALNGVADGIEIREGDIRAVGDESEWNVIVANIAPDPVIAIAPDVARLLAKGGTFIGAGIPATRGEEVCEGIRKAGLCVEALLQEEEWVSVVAHRAADVDGAA